MLQADDAAKAARKLRRAGSRMISPAVVDLPGKTLGFAKGFLARDPDGHGIQVIEK